MPDRMRIEVLDDGSFKITSDEISGPNHVTAENLLGFIARAAGGEVTRTARTDAKHHHHHHDNTQDHTHE